MYWCSKIKLVVFVVVFVLLLLLLFFGGGIFLIWLNCDLEIMSKAPTLDETCKLNGHDLHLKLTSIPLQKEANATFASFLSCDGFC